MIRQPAMSVLLLTDSVDSQMESLISYLKSIRHVSLTISPETPGDLSSYDAVLTAMQAAFAGIGDHLAQYVLAGGGWLDLAHMAEGPYPELFGARPTPAGPEAELRVLFHNSGHPIAARLPQTMYLRGRGQTLEIVAEDAETLLCADWHFSKRPVLVQREVGRGRVACTTLQAYDDPVLQRIFYRVLCFLCRRYPMGKALGVGLLGYAPSVGKIHGLGVEATAGLSLRAACDLDPERIRQVQQDFPHITTYASADLLADDADVELVIIATPPNSHASLALKMMGAGKHVVCEKPLALNRKETAAMVARAEKQQVHLSCHQNRRWDADYLAIRQVLAEGLIGDLFHMETFVGGFEHPCGYWHSHAAISGGTSYDWGAHYLDWMVSLIPERVTAVIGTRQKRLWHDVTNADQERIQVRFAGGQEAEFLHSDIAAARKPKWYLLGTGGAIIGHWRDETVFEPDPLIFFRQHKIPATEMPPDLILHRRHPSGQIAVQNLATPRPAPNLFHWNLADHLLLGEPLTAPLEQSVQVVAILEAAARSADKGGSVEELDD
jgi:predicted dehydrogenase